MTNEANSPKELDARVIKKLEAVSSAPAEFEPDEAQRAGAFVEDALSDETADELPCFIESDDGQEFDIPPFITTTNAIELFGLREGETVLEAIARSKNEAADKAQCNGHGDHS